MRRFLRLVGPRRPRPYLSPLWFAQHDPFLRLVVRLSRSSLGAALCGAILFYGLPLACIAIACPGRVVPYVTDIPNIAFTITVPVLMSGSAFMLFGNLPKQLRLLRRQHILRTDPTLLLSRITTAAHSPITTICALILGVLSILAFTYLSVVSSPTRFWGETAAAVPGIAVGFAAGLTLYAGIKGIVACVAVASGIAAHVRTLHVFREFHADGYYGLMPYVRVLSSLYWLFLLGGIGVIAPLFIGNRGSLHTMLTGIVLAIYVVCTAIALYIPITLMARTISLSKQRQICALEKRMLTKTARPKTISLSSRAAVASAIHDIRALPELPFGIRSQLPALLAYAAQLWFAVRAIWTSFSG